MASESAPKTQPRRERTGACRTRLALIALFVALAFASGVSACPTVANSPRHPGYRTLMGFAALRARYGNTFVRQDGDKLRYRYDDFQTSLAIVGEQEAAQHKPGEPYRLGRDPYSPLALYANESSAQILADVNKHTSCLETESDPKLRVEINPTIDMARAKTGTPIGFVGDGMLVKGNATWFPGGYNGAREINAEIQAALIANFKLSEVSEIAKALFGDLYVDLDAREQRSALQGSTVVNVDTGTVIYVESSKTGQGKIFVVENPFPFSKPIVWDEFSGREDDRDAVHFRDKMNEFGIDCAKIPLCAKNAEEGAKAHMLDWRDARGGFMCDGFQGEDAESFGSCALYDGRIRKDWRARPDGSIISPPWGYEILIKGNIFGF